MSRPTIGRDGFVGSCPDCRSKWRAQRISLGRRIKASEVCMHGPRRGTITLVLKISEAHGLLRALRVKP